MKIIVGIYYHLPVWNIPPAWVEELRRRFPHHQVVHVLDREGLGRELEQADVLFGADMTPSLLARAARLRWIQSSAAGVAWLMFPELVASPVIVTNTKGLQSPFIAEHCLALALALARKIHTAIRRQVEHVWAQTEISADPPSRALGGRTMGIVGLGDIGSRLAELARGIGMRVIAVRHRPQLPSSPAVERVLGPSRLDELLRASDVVVLTAAQTPATHGLIGRRELALMKPGAVLINVARGKLLNEADLAAALADGTLAGAGLDVFADEPLDPSSPLWDLPNVIITPHTSGFNSEYWPALIDLFSENLRRFEQGAPLLNVVDKQLGY